MIDAGLFRTVLTQWPSGVCVVTTVVPDYPAGADEPRRHGMTASSFSSVSLDPPLISVCLGNHLPSRRLISDAGLFGVSFLGKDQAELGRRFAGMHPTGADRFDGSDWQTAQTGAPLLADATAWLDCRVRHAYPGGDHTIFVGEVVAAATPRITAPLLFHSRAWGQLADPLPDEITVTVPAGPSVHRVRGAADLAGLPSTVTTIELTVTSIDDLDEAARVHAAATHDGLATVAYVHDAFAPGRETTVLELLDRLTALGCDTVGCAEDTDATPLQVRRLLQDAAVRVRPARLRVRLRNDHGLGLVNALVAMKSGVTCFDTAADRPGLRATDLHHLARQLGVACSEPTLEPA